MKKTFKFIILVTLVFIGMQSCIYDEEPTNTTLPQGIQMGFTIHVGGNKLDSRGVPTEGGEYVEVGNNLENMIDIENRDFKVYIYQNNDADTYIGELEIISVLGDITDNDGYNNDYYVVGRVKFEKGYSVENMNTNGFRMVVMANLNKWYKFNGYYDNQDNAIYGGYPREATKKIEINANSINRNGEGNGDGVYFYGKNAKEDGGYQPYNNEDAGFNVNTDEGGRLIPMWGIHTYTGVTLKENAITNLDAPLNMLRTMAKIEVIIDEKLELGDNTVDAVYLKGYKAHAMIEPNNDSYKNNGYNTNEDFKNPNPFWGSTSNKLKMHNLSEGNKYIVYIPEINSNEDYWEGITYNDCEIQIKLKGINAPFTFKLGAYDKDGNHTPIDILRNHIYRYTIQDIAVSPVINYQVVNWDYHTINIDFN